MSARFEQFIVTMQSDDPELWQTVRVGNGAPAPWFEVIAVAAKEDGDLQALTPIGDARLLAVFRFSD